MSSDRHSGHRWCTGGGERRDGGLLVVIGQPVTFEVDGKAFCGHITSVGAYSAMVEYVDRRPDGFGVVRQHQIRRWMPLKWLTGTHEID